jgi:hypothetical protein
MPPAKLTATILVCAFIIDRIIAMLMFATSYLQASRDTTRKGAAQRADHNRKIVYFVLSASLGAVAILALPDLRLDLSSFKGLPASMSTLLTWLVLVAGADRISAFVGVGSDAKPAAAPSETVELRVAGTLRVDADTAAKAAER